MFCKLSSTQENYFSHPKNTFLLFFIDIIDFNFHRQGDILWWSHQCQQCRRQSSWFFGALDWIEERRWLSQSYQRGSKLFHACCIQSLEARDRSESFHHDTSAGEHSPGKKDSPAILALKHTNQDIICPNNKYQVRTPHPGEKDSLATYWSKTWTWTALAFAAPLASYLCTICTSYLLGALLVKIIYSTTFCQYIIFRSEVSTNQQWTDWQSEF